MNNGSNSWLEPWLRLSFYGENDKCTKHEKQYNIVYCGLCNQKPVCEICWKKVEKEQHKDHHPVLKVCSASRRTAININMIKKFLDTSNIQGYRINNGRVVYLNSDTTGNPNSADSKSNCLICAKKLTLGNLFCSIECKKLSMDFDVRENLAPRSPPPPPTPRTLKRKMSDEVCSLRKRSRKGIPYRAPLK